MTDEAKLLLKLKAQNYDALEKAIDIYTPYLSMVLYNLAGSKLSKEDSEEIIADVFVSLWKNAALIDTDKGTLRSYMAAIARNNAIKKLTKQKDYSYLEDMETLSEGITEEIKTDYSTLWDTVISLGEPDNEIFIRYYKYDQRIKDIAKSMGINISTVKTKLLRGKKKLKKLLSDAEDML